MPPAELIAKTVPCGDREIIVTVPFPDSVELIAHIKNEHQSVPDQSGKSTSAIYKQMDEDITQSLVEVAMGAAGELVPHVNQSHTRSVWMIPYSAVQPLDRARLSIWRTKKKDVDYGTWAVKLEFSAYKAGPSGLVKLIAALTAAFPYLNINALFPAFELSRIDAAVDCVGASPLDLIAHVPKAGKRMVFVGNHGRPESVYLYELKANPKKPPQTLGYKTKGPHRLTLYERRDYHRQLKLKPPYGNCPVTRAEVPYRWTSKRPMLAGLGSIPNIWTGRRVAYAASAAPTSNRRSWRNFCMAVFGAGLDQAFFGWLPGPGGSFVKAYRNCPGDLIDQESWKRWWDGVVHTGLAEWVKKAGGVV